MKPQQASNPAGKPGERSAASRFIEKLAQLFAAAFLFACSLAVIALAVVITVNGPFSGLASLTLVCLAGALGWLSWRALSAPLFSKSPPVAQDRFSIVTGELARRSPWPEHVSPPVLAGEINQLLETGRFDQALSVIEDLAREVPDNLMLRYWKAVAFFSANRLTEAEAVLGHLVEQSVLIPVARAELLLMRLSCVFKQGQSERVAPLVEAFLSQSLSTEASIRVLDSLACVPFLEDRMDYLSEADKWSQRSLGLKPDDLTLKGTRGSLLVEQGRLEEGESLLKEVYAGSGTDIDRGISLLYLAIIAKKTGKDAEAAHLAMRAKQIYPAAWLIQRTQREFPKQG